MILERKIALAMIIASFVLPLLLLIIRSSIPVVACIALLALVFLCMGSMIFFGIPSDYVRKEK